MVIVGVALWIIWHIWEISWEKRNHAEKLKKYGNSDALKRALESD